MRCGLGGSAVVCGLFFQPIVRGVMEGGCGQLVCPVHRLGSESRVVSGAGTRVLHQCCVSTPQGESQVNTAQLAHSVFTGCVFWHKCIVCILKEYQSYQCIKSFNLMSVGGIGNTLV